MSSSPSLPPLFSCNYQLDPEHIAAMRESTDLLGDFDAIRQRLSDDGYVVLRNYLDAGEVLGARRAMLQRLADENIFDTEHHDLMDGVLRGGVNIGWRADLAKTNPAVERVVYAGAMMEFFRGLLATDVRHFDYTWVRAIPPGPATQPHCDIVYMGRGTRQLFTAWTPMGDAPLELGGLMILENSHRNQRVRVTYCQSDVDAYCSNRPMTAREKRLGARGGRGAISDNPVHLRTILGGRWLVSEFAAGDVVIFRTDLVHAGLDNRTSDRIRLSTDTRYQPASEPADERWIGQDPPAHGPRAKRGLIC